MKEILYLRSSIHPQLMRKTLIRGSILAFIGAAGLIYSGLYLDLSHLRMWGPVIFLVGLGLITLGLLPYRKLTRLESKPHEIRIVSLDTFDFLSKGQPILTMPLSVIEQFTYIERGNRYGIGLKLKPNALSQVVIQSSQLNLLSMHKKAEREFGVDLFFPYFTKRSYEELMEWQEEAI